MVLVLSLYSLYRLDSILPLQPFNLLLQNKLFVLLFHCLVHFLIEFISLGLYLLFAAQLLMLHLDLNILSVFISTFFLFSLHHQLLLFLILKLSQPLVGNCLLSQEFLFSLFYQIIILYFHLLKLFSLFLGLSSSLLFFVVSFSFELVSLFFGLPLFFDKFLSLFCQDHFFSCSGLSDLNFLFQPLLLILLILDNLLLFKMSYSLPVSFLH